MALDRILVVDPESKSIHLLRQVLTNAGFAVTATAKGERAVQLLAEERHVLVLTESSLPGNMNGCELVRRVREFSDVPVILLTSAAETDDILRGFEAGADDFIAKPFDSRILVARIRAVLNRCHDNVTAPADIRCQDLVIHPASRQVTLQDVSIYLTETEYNLLLELARHHDQVLLHEQLLKSVWGPQFCQEIDYLRSYIHILRRKLEKNPANPALIISRPGIGYMLVSARAEDPEN